MRQLYMVFGSILLACGENSKIQIDDAQPANDEASDTVQPSDTGASESPAEDTDSQNTDDSEEPSDSAEDSDDSNVPQDTDDGPVYNPELSIEENLASGVLLLEMLQHHDVAELYGVFYQGGYLFHVEAQTGVGLVTHSLADNEATHWNDFYNQAPDLGLGTAIGTGESNTNAIVSALGEDVYAARYAYDAELNGYEDWFLPSLDELTAIYERLHVNGLGNANSGMSYWTSTDEGYYAWVIYFSNGNTYTPSKFHPHHNVLPIRNVR